MKSKIIPKKAFTLVEMLVVITIIAVLAALLMPALSSAKDRSKAVKCANNQKQIGAAFSGYLNDNNGFYPYIYPNCASTNNGYCTCGLAGYPPCAGGAQCTASMAWNVVLAPYYGFTTNSFVQRTQQNMCGVNWCSTCSTKTYQEISEYATFMQCPSNPWQIPLFGAVGGGCLSANAYGGFAQPGGAATWRMMATTYAMNGNGFPADWRPAFQTCTNNAGWYKRENIADVNHPSGLALIGEMPWCAWIVASPPNVWNATYLPGQTYMTASVVTNTGLAYQWKQPTAYTYCNGYVAAWHGMKMNTLFPDGHVEQVPQSTLMTNAVQFTAGNVSSPGGIFWGDGKPANWFANQFPGAPFPTTFQ